MYLPFTPVAIRHESPHGQGTQTYDEYNARPQAVVNAQMAPDPIRQGDTPSRPSRHPIAIMSTDPRDYGYGIPEDFLPYYKTEIVPNRNRGGQLNVRAQNSVGVRPNIDRGNVAAYGSLFSLSGNVYDESRG